MGWPEGRANFSLPWSWGFRGQLEGSPERRIASAGTVHGGSHTSAARPVGRAAAGTGATPAMPRTARRSRCRVRECQGHDARTRRQCAVRCNVCLIVLAIMLRRRASDRRSIGRVATGGKTGGGYAAAFPSLAKLGFGRRFRARKRIPKHSLPAAPSTRHFGCKYFLQFYYPLLAGAAMPRKCAVYRVKSTR